MSVPEVGQVAPDFEVLGDNGEPVRLSDFRGQRVVLYFYPAADTPGCTTQSCAYRDNYGEFANHNAVILGASPDTVEAQAAFKVKYHLPFILLADHERKVIDAYGIYQTYINRQGVETTGVRRSSFIIDENGVITGVFIGVDPANNTQEMLAHLS